MALKYTTAADAPAAAAALEADEDAAALEDELAAEDAAGEDAGADEAVEDDEADEELPDEPDDEEAHPPNVIADAAANPAASDDHKKFLLLISFSMTVPLSPNGIPATCRRINRFRC